MRKRQLKQRVAMTIASILLIMSVVPHIPPNIMMSLAADTFKPKFENSGTSGHPDIYGTIPAQRKTAFFCMDEGASAKSGYTYIKEDKDVSYSDGSLADKRLFWAYILTHGSAPVGAYADDNSLLDVFGMPFENNTLAGKKVAWKRGKEVAPDPIEKYANDGFKQLESIPAGCKDPKEIFKVTSLYSSPDKALNINEIKSGPGQIDLKKLYEVAGISDLDSFKKYCTLNPEPVKFTGPGGGEGNVKITWDDYTVSFSVVDANGNIISGQHEPIIIKVKYDPKYFTVIDVSGRLEWFKCTVAGSQELYRAMGKVDVSNPEFYLTTSGGQGLGAPGGGTGGDGGDLTGGDTISVDLYEHTETFESNYKVDLKKYDYETGLPLKDSTWEVLEAFPDKDKLESNEADGALIEDNMREAPTTWDNWLIFEDDMKTDANGYISHADQRFYDFSHKYCDGHPIPPAPEPSDDPDPDAAAEADAAAAEEYADLMAQWQDAVNECVQTVQSSNGTFHHWECGSETKPTEEEAFEGSGCKEVRDNAYDNFINLRYSYTFMETDARDGYIIHGQNGHPDDVPIEIITTAASEANKPAEWTKASNQDIIIAGYVRNLVPPTREKDKRARSTEDTNASYAGEAIDSGNYETLYLSEEYDLTMGEKTINALRQFFGLPEQFVSENNFEVKVVAGVEDDVKEATPSELDQADEGLEDSELMNDITKPAAESTAAEETRPEETKPEETKPEETKTEETTVPETKESEETTAVETTSHETEEETKDSLPEISISENNVPLVKSREESDDIIDEDELDSDEEYMVATPSEATYRSERKNISIFEEENQEYTGRSAREDDAGGFIDLESAIVDSQPPADAGPSDNLAHTFLVYDHRVPGQIHFNKKDMELSAGESDRYDAYGDTQGDSSLEGAVYGLFAADTIHGPDTQLNADGNVQAGTGVIFDANDLVSVAVTDKNGDGSFLTITERPHSVYNYKTGGIEYTGKAYPKNLYDKDGYEKANPKEDLGRIYKDNLNVNGDYWIGRPLILGNYYIKELSRSEGFELSITGKDMAVSNADETNRDEYGETADSKSNPLGSAWITSKLTNAVTFPEGNPAYGNRENLFSVGVGSNNTTKGYNVVVDGLPEGADFYYDNVETKPIKVQVQVGGKWEVATEAPLYLTAKDAITPKTDIDGQMVINPSAVKNVPTPFVGVAQEVKKLPDGLSATAKNPSKYNAAYSNDFNYLKAETEAMMRDLGIRTPNDSGYSTEGRPVYDRAGNGEYGMPEIILDISGITKNSSLINAVLDYFTTQKVFSYGSVQAIQYSGGTAKVTVAVGMSPNYNLLYEKNSAGDIIAGYLFKLNETTKRFVMKKYTGANIIAMQVPGSATKYKLQLKPDFTINSAGMPEDVMDYGPDKYLYYNTGDVLYDYWVQQGGVWVGHEAIRRKVYVPIFEEREVTEETVNSSQVPMVDSKEDVADPVGSTYVVYDQVSKQYTLHVGTVDADLTGAKTSGFTIAIADGSTTLTQADIDKIGENNVWGYKVGQSLNNSQYLVKVAGAGAGVFTSEDFNQDTSFIKNQRLIYNGNHNLSEDGNTNNAPNPVKERIIGQQIKVTKDIVANSYQNTNSYSEVHEDWFTEVFGGLLGQNPGAKKVDNFRFKVYLKSNLESLYRDDNGEVVWQDRAGTGIDQLQRNEDFPALVNKIYTKVLHVTTPIFEDSRDAIVSNDALYAYTSGLINEDQNHGYTSVLESMDTKVEDNTGTRNVSAYNYDKLFDALTVANNDKWDDASPTYTTWQPIGNASNRTGNAIENAKVSDMVRQFAIDWYLDDEIKKLVKTVPNNGAETEDQDGIVPYSDEMYDEALRYAIIKAENYLKPFFSYDLDKIYSIEWDSENDGGTDRDFTTLSANTLFGDAENSTDGYYFATSKYLPYGTYVVAEQQPRYDNLEDFKNKHYQIDKPREVILPSVYADYDGSQASPEVTNDYYNYSATISQTDMERKYKIRFNEEAVHVIKGRNADGDFEVYKYGMNIENIRNGVTGTGAGDYFALTQSEFKPYKNYYNADDDRTNGIIPYYLTEGLSGQVPVSKYYRFSSVAENQGIANDVAYPNGTVTEDNVGGIQYKDNVITMHGVQTAYDGKYASMLVPWTVVASENAATEVTDSIVQATGESSYKGFGYNKFRNRFFTSKLRIEKLDSETHENILHSDAVFNIYAAKRDDSKNGNGQVLFYDAPTVIEGTREFLEAMCATDITPMIKRASFIDRLTGKEYGPGNLYTGTVPAGTPICEESEKIILGDSYGNRTVAFKSYSTVLDGKMKDEATNTTLTYQNQTVGYVETPQPLGAGAYVIAEVKAPSGYTRSKPVALEVYSDKVTYYKEADRDKRVLAAMYEYPSAHQTTNGTKPQDIVNLARINVENAPIKLTVEKIKESSFDTASTTPNKTVTYKVSGRIDGPLATIGNNPDYEYAYNDAGEYLGYAWKKGTLENLVARQKAGEDVQIAYEGTMFAGYGFVTKKLETADDGNKHVAGATMTLFDALEIAPSGDTQDVAYEGLVINRSGNNNINRMYVKQGYAGNKVEFVKEKDENGNEYTIDYEAGVDKNGNPLTANGNIWTVETIERPDTDILNYDLDSLEIFKVENVDGKQITYGYDKNHDKVAINQIESDKINHPKTDTEYAIYAFKGGIPYLEFVGGDFKDISYSSINKVITVGKDTVVYHLDRDGNRDAMVDPYTGMAYVTEARPDGSNRILVWAVNIRKDEFGNVIVKDKITTSRVATVGENQDGYQEDATLDVTNNSGNAIPDKDKPFYSHSESGYITGSWESGAGEESHKESTVNQNEHGQNMNGEVLVDDNNGTFNKELNPTYDGHGLVDYYQRSDETYDKGTELYDRNGDFVRYQDSDNLSEYNGAAYRINENGELYDGDSTKENQAQKELYHRQGEGYILENTWVTSEKTPNDPFDTKLTDGQPDVLKRVPVGHYILEELVVPEGYLKGMPTAITVQETAAMQRVAMIDKTTKTEISKIDGTDKHIYDLVNMETGLVEGTVEEGKGSFGNGQVSDAIIALYRAKKVYTSDFTNYPNGYYLVRASETDGPITYYATDSMVSNIRELTAKWTTGATPIYIEGIPEGYYLLEELDAPDGFTTSKPVEVMISNTAEVQTVIINDDHTKVEIAKHEMTDNGKEILNGAGFTLYKGQVDGSYNPADVVATWISDDATDYTQSINLKDYPNTSGDNKETGFTSEFEAMFKAHGTTAGTNISWAVERKAVRNSADDNVWILEDRTLVKIINGVITFPAGMSQEDMDGFYAAYQANAKNKNTIQWANQKSAGYVSHTQIDSSTIAGNTSTTKFPSTATLIFETNDGKQIQITAYQKTAKSGGQSYTFEYKYDYETLPGINKYACTYLTATGHRRFDYLPVGSTYVLVETLVPEGYAKADDTVITVKDMLDVQYYSIMNETTAIRISKVTEKGAGELAGAKLALYKANADGSLTQTDGNLITTWVTGEDGSYTDTDFVNGLIPEGYKKGDLKPHTIRGLEDGIYYVVELDAPDYYTLIEPIKIDYRGADEIRIVRVKDEPVIGELIIHKTDKGDAPLVGVTFQITAYRHGTGETVLNQLVSDTNGKVTVKDLPVGDIGPDGSILPYTYKVREITPPDGYAASGEIKTFQFEPDKNGVSYSYGEFALAEMKVKNDKTEIYVEKRNFAHLNDNGIDGAFLDGAVLAVYDVRGRDAQDNLLYDEKTPIDVWTTSLDEPRHLITGLVAGKTYLLKELKAPTGYNLMKPVAFTISSSGRSIYSITNKVNTVTVDYIKAESGYLDTDNLDIDSIDSVTVTGRYVAKTEMVITDNSGNEVARWVSNGKVHTLFEDDAQNDVKDGVVYTFSEYACYSDGSRTITSKTTKRVNYDQKGEFNVNTRTVNFTRIAINWIDGTEIANFVPNEYVAYKVIKNNINPENPKITMKARNGENGDALNPKQAVINTISYTNTGNIKADVTVTAKVSSGTTILNAYGADVNGSTIKWIIPDVPPATSGYVTLDTQISTAALSASLTGTVAVNGKNYTSTKTVPVTQPNKLTLYNELTGSGKEIYANESTNFRVKLFSEVGELKGTFKFVGSKSGEIKSGGTVSLSGNEFITIDPGNIYKNIRYKIERVPDGSQKVYESRNTEGIATEELGAFSTFSRNVKDTSEREIFKEGESYLLTETTTFSDGEVKESNKLQFTLNENGSVSSVGGYDKETHITLSKTDITSGKELPGAHIVIKDKDQNVIEEWVSTDKPHEIVGKLTPGEEYTMVETGAPDGYAYAEEIKFKVNEDGTVDTVVMADKQTHVIFRKTDITTGKELPGAHIVIRDKHGNIVEEWTSSDKPHEIVGKLIAGETYTMIEEGAADGYAYAANITFTVSLDGRINLVTMEDKPTHVTLRKTDIVTGEELPGAYLVIKDKHGNTVEKWISTDKPHEIIAKLIAGEEYTLIEVGPPDGYAFASEIKFTVSKDGTIDRVVMEDKPTHVSLSKTDITTGQELPGAHIVIKDKDGIIVDEWISTDIPHQIVGKLVADEEYTMIETLSPNGYGYAAEIRFRVNKNGEVDRVVMEDKPTNVIISKVDNSSGKELPGATLRIVDKNGNVIEEWVSTDKPHEIIGKLVAGEEYTLVEVASPGGYHVATDIKFTVNRDGSVTLITMRDSKVTSPGGNGGGEDPKPKYPVTIKKSNVDDELVSDAEYGIFSTGGKLIASGFTSSSGTITLYVTELGDYYIQEISAPSGYALSPMKYPITVTATGVTGKTDVVDEFAIIAISKQDVATLEALQGAVFTLYSLDGTPVTTAISGPEGYAEFRKVLHGDYYIMETGAPEGYELSPEPRYVSVSKHYTNAAPIIWYNNPDWWTGRPRTGDDSPIIPVSILLVLAAFGYCFLAKKKKKKE